MLGGRDVSEQRQPGVWNRRELLGAGCFAAGALCSSRVAVALDIDVNDEGGLYGPFKMGLQS
jgi:hypothetical protein